MIFILYEIFYAVFNIVVIARETLWVFCLESCVDLKIAKNF